MALSVILGLQRRVDDGAEIRKQFGPHASPPDPSIRKCQKERASQVVRFFRRTKKLVLLVPAIDSNYSGSRFMIQEWGYADVGIYFGHAPSAGHDGFMLDYREYGPPGEPRVIHVDTEADVSAVTILLPNFETFVLGVVDCAAFHD